MRILKAVAPLAAGVFLSSMGVSVAWAQNPCADLGGALDGTMCRMNVSNATYTMQIDFPVDYADQQAVTDYVAQTRDGFVNVAQMPGSTSLPYQLDIDAEQNHSGVGPHGTQSVALKIFQDVGGAHPTTWYKAFNYNLDGRKPITFATLFNAGAKPLDVIFPIVKRELERQTGLNGPMVQTGDGLDPSHYQNFGITDTELVFYFAQGELLPQSAGAVTARVPRDAVASMLAPLV